MSRADPPSRRRLPSTAEPEPEEPSAAKRSIFDATEELLDEIALEELKVSDILGRAGVARTTFYRHFDSKHAVVSAMLEGLQAELVGVMRPWFARGDDDPETALRAAIEAVAEVWARHRPVLRASSEHWHSQAEIGRQWMAMMERFTADIAKQIDRERRAGSAPSGVQAKRLALQLTWGSERMFYLAGFGLVGKRLERDAVDAIVATWMGAVYRR